MIRENVANEAAIWKQLVAGKNVVGGNYFKLLDYLVEHGQEFKGQKLPKRYTQRQMKACYYNAWKLVRGSKTLRYVEGKAIGGCVPFCFDHAWAIDQAGKVIDPTLRGCEDFEYLGVVFDRDELPTRYDENSTPLHNRVLDHLNKQLTSTL